MSTQWDIWPSGFAIFSKTVFLDMVLLCCQQSIYSKCKTPPHLTTTNCKAAWLTVQQVLAHHSIINRFFKQKYKQKQIYTDFTNTKIALIDQVHGRNTHNRQQWMYMTDIHETVRLWMYMTDIHETVRLTRVLTRSSEWMPTNV